MGALSRPIRVLTRPGVGARDAGRRLEDGRSNPTQQPDQTERLETAHLAEVHRKTTSARTSFSVSAACGEAGTPAIYSGRDFESSVWGPTRWVLHGYDNERLASVVSVVVSGYF